MVKQIFRMVTREISGLHQAAYILALFTFLSQLLGLVRDRLLAHTFGADVALDIYYASFRIPDLVLVFAASVVSIAILVPYLTEKLQSGKESGKRFIDQIFTAFFLAIIVVSAILFFLVPWITLLVFPGFMGEERELLIGMTRILLLSPILLGLSNLFAGVVQVYRRFLIYSLSPLLYNVGIIFGIVILEPIMGLRGLVLGVILGATLHLLIQIPTIISHGFLPKFTRSINWRELRGIALVSLPRAFTLSINQVMVIVLLGLASIMADGSIAIFNFSFNLQSVPLGLVGVSYSLAAFPALSKFFAERRYEEFALQIATAARHIIFWSLPAISLFIILRAHIVRTVLGTGEFGWAATRLTAAALGIFVLSVIAQSIVLLLVRGYYALGNTREPLYVALFSGAVTVCLAFFLKYIYENSNFFASLFEDFWRVEGIPGVVVLMLPLAYSLGVFFNALILWNLFNRKFRGLTRSVSRTFWQSLAASIVIGFLTYSSLIAFEGLFDTRRALGVFMQALLAGGVGIFSGILTLYLLRNAELAELVVSLRRKLRPVEVIGPDTEEL